MPTAIRKQHLLMTRPVIPSQMTTRDQLLRILIEIPKLHPQKTTKQAPKDSFQMQTRS